MAFAGLLAVCRPVYIGFNNGATVSCWWLNSYVDFEGEQKPRVKRHIDELFAWHRRTQLRGHVEPASRIRRRGRSNTGAATSTASRN